jgi:hypothetical protein
VAFDVVGRHFKETMWNAKLRTVRYCCDAIKHRLSIDCIFQQAGGISVGAYYVRHC